MNFIEILIVGGALEIQEQLKDNEYIPLEDTIEARLQYEKFNYMMELTDRVITCGGLGPEDFEKAEAEAKEAARIAYEKTFTIKPTARLSQWREWNPISQNWELIEAA